MYKNIYKERPCILVKLHLTTEQGNSYKYWKNAEAKAAKNAAGAAKVTRNKLFPEKDKYASFSPNPHPNVAGYICVHSNTAAGFLPLMLFNHTPSHRVITCDTHCDYEQQFPVVPTTMQ